MGFYTNSGTTTASINGSITTTSTQYTPVFVATSRSSAGTTAVFTVPANKKYTIIGIHTTVVGAQNTITSATITANGTTVQQVIGRYIITDGYGNIDDRITLTKDTGIVLTAGQVCNLVQGSTGSVYTEVIYIEESV